MNGIDPGFANDIVPLALAGTCQSVESIRSIEICDYSTYNDPVVMRDLMGFGRPLDDIPLVTAPGSLKLAWGSTVTLVAKWLGVALDEITENSIRVPAPDAFDTAWGHIAEGTAAALRFEVTGWVDGAPVAVAEHVTRMRDDLCPDWPRPVSGSYTYRIEITGEPFVFHGLQSQRPQRRPCLRGYGRHRVTRRQQHPRGGGGTAGPAVDRRDTVALLSVFDPQATLRAHPAGRNPMVMSTHHELPKVIQAVEYWPRTFHVVGAGALPAR